MKTKAIVLGIALAIAAYAQQTIILGSFYTKPDRLIQLLPQLMPSSPTNLCAQDIYVTEMTFTNITGSAVIVIIKDRQVTPAIIFQSSIAANTNYIVHYDSRWSPSGITWSADTGNAVVGYITGKY